MDKSHFIRDISANIIYCNFCGDQMNYQEADQEKISQFKEEHAECKLGVPKGPKQAFIGRRVITFSEL